MPEPISRPPAKEPPPGLAPHPAPPAVERSIQALRRIIRWLRLTHQQVVQLTGITAAQLFVLTILANEDHCSLQELAERTMTDRTSVRDVIKPLESRDLIERRADPNDRRRSMIRVTERGKELLRSVPEPPTPLLVQGLLAFDPDQQQALAGMLEMLVGHMGLAQDPAGFLFHDPTPSAADDGDGEGGAE